MAVCGDQLFLVYQRRDLSWVYYEVWKSAGHKQISRLWTFVCGGALRHIFSSADSAETLFRRESIGSYNFLSSAPSGGMEARVEGGPLMQIAEVARSITG